LSLTLAQVFGAINGTYLLRSRDAPNMGTH